MDCLSHRGGLPPKRGATAVSAPDTFQQHLPRIMTFKIFVAADHCFVARAIEMSLSGIGTGPEGAQRREDTQADEAENMRSIHFG